MCGARRTFQADNSPITCLDLPSTISTCSQRGVNKYRPRNAKSYFRLILRKRRHHGRSFLRTRFPWRRSSGTGSSFARRGGIRLGTSAVHRGAVRKFEMSLDQGPSDSYGCVQNPTPSVDSGPMVARRLLKFRRKRAKDVTGLGYDLDVPKRRKIDNAHETTRTQQFGAPCRLSLQALKVLYVVTEPDNSAKPLATDSVGYQDDSHQSRLCDHPLSIYDPDWNCSSSQPSDLEPSLISPQQELNYPSIDDPDSITSVTHVTTTDVCSRPFSKNTPRAREHPVWIKFSNTLGPTFYRNKTEDLDFDPDLECPQGSGSGCRSLFGLEVKIPDKSYMKLLETFKQPGPKSQNYGFKELLRGQGAVTPVSQSLERKATRKRPAMDLETQDSDLETQDSDVLNRVRITAHPLVDFKRTRRVNMGGTLENGSGTGNAKKITQLPGLISSISDMQSSSQSLDKLAITDTSSCHPDTDKDELDVVPRRPLSVTVWIFYRDDHSSSIATCCLCRGEKKVYLSTVQTGSERAQKQWKLILCQPEVENVDTYCLIPGRFLDSRRSWATSRSVDYVQHNLTTGYLHSTTGCLKHNTDYLQWSADSWMCHHCYLICMSNGLLQKGFYTSVLDDRTWPQQAKLDWLTFGRKQDQCWDWQIIWSIRDTKKLWKTMPAFCKMDFCEWNQHTQKLPGKGSTKSFTDQDHMSRLLGKDHGKDSLFFCWSYCINSEKYGAFRELPDMDVAVKPHICVFPCLFQELSCQSSENSSSLDSVTTQPKLSNSVNSDLSTSQHGDPRWDSDIDDSSHYSATKKWQLEHDNSEKELNTYLSSSDQSPEGSQRMSWSETEDNFILPEAVAYEYISDTEDFLDSGRIPTNFLRPPEKENVLDESDHEESEVSQDVADIFHSHPCFQSTHLRSTDSNLNKSVGCDPSFPSSSSFANNGIISRIPVHTGKIKTSGEPTNQSNEIGSCILSTKRRNLITKTSRLVSLLQTVSKNDLQTKSAVNTINQTSREPVHSFNNSSVVCLDCRKDKQFAPLSGTPRNFSSVEMKSSQSIPKSCQSIPPTAEKSFSLSKLSLLRSHLISSATSSDSNLDDKLKLFRGGQDNTKHQNSKRNFSAIAKCSLHSEATNDFALAQMKSKKSDPFLCPLVMADFNPNADIPVVYEFGSKLSEDMICCRDTKIIAQDALGSPDHDLHDSCSSESVPELDNFLGNFPSSASRVDDLLQPIPFSAQFDGANSGSAQEKHVLGECESNTSMASSCGDYSLREVSVQPSLLRKLLDKEKKPLHGSQTHIEWQTEQTLRQKSNIKKFKVNPKLTEVRRAKLCKSSLQTSVELPLPWLHQNRIFRHKKPTQELPLPASSKARTLQTMKLDKVFCKDGSNQEMVDAGGSKSYLDSGNEDCTLPDDLIDMAVEYCAKLTADSTDDIISNLSQDSFSFEDSLYSLIGSPTQDSRSLSSTNYCSTWSQTSMPTQVMAPTRIALSSQQAQENCITAQANATSQTNVRLQSNVYTTNTSISQSKSLKGSISLSDILASNPFCNIKPGNDLNLFNSTKAPVSESRDRKMSLLRAAVTSPDVDKLIQLIPLGNTQTCKYATQKHSENASPDSDVSKLTKCFELQPSQRSIVHTCSPVDSSTKSTSNLTKILSQYSSNNPRFQSPKKEKHFQGTTLLNKPTVSSRPCTSLLTAPRNVVSTTISNPGHSPIILKISIQSPSHSKFTIGENIRTKCHSNKLTQLHSPPSNQSNRSIKPHLSLSNHITCESTTDSSTSQPISVMIMRKEHHRSRRSKSIAVQTDNHPDEVYPQFEHSSTDTYLYPSVMIFSPSSPESTNSTHSDLSSTSSLTHLSQPRVSELEKLVRWGSCLGSDCSSVSSEDSCQLRSSQTPLLQKLLLGELNQHQYQQLDQQMLQEEKQLLLQEEK